tara:strand:- start:410 stop:562 length:153 start_codon:yes stop_codon:yes gene_type:complete
MKSSKKSLVRSVEITLEKKIPNFVKIAFVKKQSKGVGRKNLKPIEYVWHL